MFLLTNASLTAFGEILVAYTVVKVHARIMREHKIDAAVLKTMRKEQQLALVGIFMIALGWALSALNTIL